MPVYQFDFSTVLAYAPTLAAGTAITLVLSGVGALGGLVLGIGGAWGRTWGPRWLDRPLGAYVELVRNTPFLIQLFFFYFALPSVGVHLSGFEASMSALVFNMGAYNTEIIRAGIEATPLGQIEAAASMAMRPLQTFFFVIVKPALVRIWPALCAQTVLLMLDSAVCSQVSTGELTYVANTIASHTFRSFETYLVATAIYFLLAVGIRRILLVTEHHLIAARRSAK